MGYVADRLIGILVDENNCSIQDLYTSVEKTYSIIGLKAFNISGFTTYNIGLEDAVENATVDNFENKYLHIKEYRDGTPTVYSISDRKYHHGKKSDKVLPVYDSDGNFLFSLNGNAFYMDFVWSTISNNSLSGILVKVDVYSEIIELVLDKRNSFPINYFSNHGDLSSWCVHDYEVQGLFEKYSEHIHKYGNICYIKNIEEDTVLVPDDCKYLIIDTSFIANLVLNSTLDTLVCNSLSLKKLKTVYISKELSKNLMGCLFWSLCLYDYMYSGRNNADSSILYSKLRKLRDCGNFVAIWDICNEPSNRQEMDRLLDRVNIVVY